MYLAIKEIKKEKGRFAMIVLVMAFIAYLVFFLSSLAYGLASINRTAIDHWDFDEITLRSDANENILASFITQQDLEASNSNETDTMRIRGVSFKLVDEPIDAILVGASIERYPEIVRLKSGHYPESKNEVLLSYDVFKSNDYKLGDTLALTKYGTYEIVGVTESSNYNTRPVLYTTLEGSQLGEGDPVSLVIGSKVVSDEFVSLTKSQVIDNLPGYQAQILTFGLMIGSLSIISALIIGVFMYILTMQKKPIFGILKVQGFKNKTIIQSIIIQTFLLTIVGLALGFVLSEVTCIFLKGLVPVATYLPLSLGVTLAMVAFSLFGSLFSSRIILKIDPLKSL